MLNLGGDDSSEEDEEIELKPVAPAAKRAKTDPGIGSILLKTEDEEEEDEEDEPLSAPETKTRAEDAENNAANESAEATEGQPMFVASQEFTDALDAITSDRWNSAAWLVYMEEVENARGGTVTTSEAFSKCLDVFPRASSVWLRLCESNVKNDDLELAEENYSKCLDKCRSTKLWLSYLKMMKQTTIETANSKNKKECLRERQKYEAVCEKALDNVGMSPDSYPIWRVYLDCLRDGREIETGSAAGKKLSALRKVYQRALSTPMENLEKLWTEYKYLEQSEGGGQGADVSEYENKYLKAVTIFKERKKYTSLILFDRFATPPTHSLKELQQLDIWNKYIKYELGNPGNLPAEQFHSMVHLLFDQCLCCLLYNQEVWMSLARFELDKQPACVTDARAVLKEAVAVIPDSPLLRIMLAELEETHGGTHGIETAREVLKTAFESIPSSFTFAAYQRFVRRVDGMAAARKVFSDTLPLRTKKILGYEVFMVHAQMELEVNCCPDVAVKVLDLAKATDPIGASEVGFVRLLIRVLMRLGDLKQIRWVFQTVLSDTLPIRKAYRRGQGNIITSAMPETQQGSSTLGLKDQLQLWEDYLAAETVLGLSNVARLDELRGHRDRVRNAIDDAERARMRVDRNVFAEDRGTGLFVLPRDLCERYDYIAPPSQDVALRNRSRGRELLKEVTKIESEKIAARKEAAYTRRRQGEEGKDDGKADADGDVAGVPALIREFIARLPSYSGPPIDMDVFIKHMKSIALPARPSIEDGDAFAYGQKEKKSRQDQTDDPADDDDDMEDDSLFDMSLREYSYRRSKKNRFLM